LPRRPRSTLFPYTTLFRSDGTPLLLRDRAGDYMRQLFAEASGFDGDPANLGGMPISHCTHDACIAAIRKGSGEWRLLATRSAYPDRKSTRLNSSHVAISYA